MAATDSIRIVDNDYVQRIHGGKPPGRLHKGHGIVAATASIPSKYQTVVTDNSDKRGFQSQARRFNRFADMTENPGPGNYVGHSSMINNSTSFSKKGTGGFASKSRRQIKYESSIAPGPGIYALPTLLAAKKDFNKSGASRLFQAPVASNVEKVSPQPAPNQYNVLDSNVGKSNNISANASFKSQTRREVINVKEASKKPAPCQYDVRDDLTHKSVKINTSSFKSKSKRQMQAEPDPSTTSDCGMSGVSRRLIQNPGPGTYDPYENDAEVLNRMMYPRKHYLCISAPAMPMPVTPPLPGPGSYNVVDYEGLPKHYMSGSAFVSTTSRWQGDVKNTTEMPGPAHYRPLSVGKQSFIYNASGRWI